MSTTSTTPDLSIVGTEHPNAIRTREAFAAFAAGDLATVQASFLPDATWTNAGTSAMAGTYCGWDEISAMFGRLLEATGFTYRNELVDVLADDTHTVSIYDATSTVAGVEATMRFVLVDEVTPDGKVSACRNLAYDQEAADAHLGRGMPQQRG